MVRFLSAPEPPPPAPQLLAAACPVASLTDIEDPEALMFEGSVGSEGVVNVEGLTPETSRAIDHFSRLVALHGGRMTVTSAYRPASYQQHLTEVWDKWMVELRYNRMPECGELRARAEQEFRMHELLERQRPVALSDHTRGLAFDASVFLPRLRRRVTMDSLALRAGLMRPDRFRDPVHFKLRF